MNRLDKLFCLASAFVMLAVMPSVYVFFAPRLPALPHFAWLQLMNAGLCWAGALIAFGAANHMSRETEKTIMAAFATVGAGLIGEGLATLIPGRWDQAIDTVLYGGIAALLVGTRRSTVWLAPELMPRISAGLTAATWLAFGWAI